MGRGTGFFDSWDANKCRVNLRLAMNRLKLLKNKKGQVIKSQRKEVADLLRDSKEDQARIRVEHVIREDRTIEAYELLELFCDLLLARFQLISSEKHCAPDVREAVCTVIWAATRSEVRELEECKKQFVHKYGKEFVGGAMQNEGDCVNPRVMHRLSYSAPEQYLVLQYLGNIAKEFGVDWEHDTYEEQIVDLAPGLPPPINPEAPNGGGGGGGMAMPPGGGMGPPGYPVGWGQPAGGAQPPPYPAEYPAYPGEPPAPYPPAPVEPVLPVQPPPPYVPNDPLDQLAGMPPVGPPPPYQPAADPAGEVKSPAADPAPGGATSDRVPDFDELAARFEALKRK